MPKFSSKYTGLEVMLKTTSGKSLRAVVIGDQMLLGVQEGRVLRVRTQQDPPQEYEIRLSDISLLN